MTSKAKLPFDPRVFLATIGKGRTITEYPKDQVIFAQRDRADSIFYIQKGKVKLTVKSKNGKEGVIAIFGVGDFFGEGCLAAQRRRMATATTLSDCSLVRLEKSAIALVLHEKRPLSDMFRAYLLSRIIRLEEDLVNQLLSSSEQRLARLLLLLANFGQEGKPEPLIARINQETLAEMVGTTRARVSFFMNKFRKLGFIDYNASGLRIHSSLSNVVLHD